jgi:hypothetical protein
LKCQIFVIITLSILFISSCTTVKPEFIESFILVDDEEEDMVANVSIPDISLFVSAPFEKSQEILVIGDADVIIPEEDVPVEKVIEKTVDLQETFSQDKKTAVKPVILLPVDEEPVEESPVEVKPKEKEQNQQVIVVENKVLPVEVLSTPADQELEIIMDQEGWIYNGSDKGIQLLSRSFNEGSTRFIFTFKSGGEYVLNFTLQNPSTGQNEEVAYDIKVEDPDNEEFGPVVIEAFGDEGLIPDPEVIHNDIKTALIDENIPEIIASFDQLLSDDEVVDNQTYYDVFTLLEDQGGYDKYLVDLAERVYKYYPYDNLSAEMLYKAAQALEQPGSTQNIEKALIIFKLVREQFPISIYSDKSEERIRYLERHFMKIY